MTQPSEGRAAGNSPQELFNAEHAATYDDRFAKASALREALQLVARLALSELPAEARLLSVGAGTGLELSYLADAFPGWRFVAVEPAPAMLAVCRQRAVDAGFADRCEFHEGFLDSLPPGEPFDGATCLLVSQFLWPPERRALFAEIAARLTPAGVLVSADLALDRTTTAHGRLMELWWRMWRGCDIPAEEAKKMFSELDQKVSILAPSEVAELVCSAGFEEPTQVLQTLLIHGWSFRRAASSQ